MKNKLKYLLVLLLIVPCVFILSACNNKVVVNIEKSSSSTTMTQIYTITYSDGSKSSFSIQNGQDGQDLEIKDIYQTAKDGGVFTGSFSEFLEVYLQLDVNIDHREVINQSLMSVVSIYSEFNYEKSNIINSVKDTAIGYGSGVVYKLDKSSGDAYIITNYHVVYYQGSGKVANKINCALYGNIVEFDWITREDGSYVNDSNGYPKVKYIGDVIGCEYIGGSLLYDIAVLKISGSQSIKNSGLKQATFADSNNIVVGETAIAIGNPQNLGISATQGIISVDSEYRVSELADGSYAKSRAIRMDTSVNGGNSGGGLFNSKGEVIGIVNAKLIDESIENIGYAIPSNIAKSVADSIIRNSGNGLKNASKAVIGITLEAKNAVAVYDETLKRVVVKEEIYISSVIEDSLAQQYGLKVGDRVLSMSFKGKTYDISRIFHATDLSWQYEVGDVIGFEIEGKSQKINVIITQDCFSKVD